MRRDAFWMAVVVILAVGAVSCSSDRFGPTGSGLPAEVSQDSLGAVISVVGTAREVSFEPPLDQPLQDRELLFLGQKQAGGWRATPMLRFEIAAVLDTLDTAIAAFLTDPDSVTRWRSARLDLNLRTSEPNAGVIRNIDLYDLADTLDVSMLESDLASVQGALLETLTDRNASLDIDLDPNIVFQWISEGGHRGVALVDRTAPEPDQSLGNLVGYFSNNALGGDERPEIVLGLPDPEGLVDEIFVGFPVILDFTLFEVPDESDAIVLGSHLPARPWLRFDLSSVPPAASVNGATLTLCLDPDRSLMNVNLFYSAFAVDEAQAESGETLEDDLILGSSGILAPDELEMVEIVGEDTLITTLSTPPRSFQVDVTDFVQRAVNGVFDFDVDGISLVGQLELFDLQRVVLFGSSVAVDTLRPRLDITFTPPIDFEE